MSSEDKKPAGRRGAGRGRRQPVTPQEAPPPGPIPTEESLTLATYPTPGEAAARSRESPDSGSPEGSPKGSPPGDDMTEKMKDMQVTEFIRPLARPGFGVVGNKVRVLANHFEVRLDKELNVVHYHVDVSHDRMKLNKDDKRLIFWTTVVGNRNVFPNVYRLAYDGDHMCISLDRLQLSGGKGESGQALGKYTPRVRLPRMEREETFTVVMNPVALIAVNMEHARAAGASGDRYTQPLHVLDLLFRQRRSFPMDAQTKQQWFSFASTVYRIPPNGNGAELTCGRVIWQGLFGAARVGQALIPYINFDVSHSGFYRPQSVLAFMIEILNTFCGHRDRNAPPKFRLEEMDSRTTLQKDWIQAINRALKGLKVTMITKKADGQNYEHEYTVNQVVPENAQTHTFAQRQQNGEERMLSVAEYFKERYGPLKYPALNLLHVGPKKTRKCYLPMEHCTISYNQRVKKLSPAETSTMIKAAAINATNRREKVSELVRNSEFAQDPWLREFGIRVNPNMKEVDGRILEPPKIRFSPSGRNPVIQPRDGVWDMRGQKFFSAAGCQRIGALVLDDRDMNMYSGFFGFLLQTCKELGMNVPTSIPPNAIQVVNQADNSGIEQALTKLKGMGAEFVVVTLPQKSAPHYSEVKRAAEITVGIMTQCVVKANIQKCMNKNDRMTTTNIALKMNMKMGGINSLADANDLAKRVLTEQPTLVLGIDVTHPAQQEKKMPSISSVVGNMDDSFMKYGASIRVQKHRRESIVAGHLDQQVKDRLMDYHQSVMADNKLKNTSKQSRPTRIIIFRDGVAEGQFQEVLKEELGGIRQACKDLDATYRPKLTLIVAQKRHHTRFFPTQAGPTSGKGFNIVPGTVIDKDITHPDQFEFYLCAHFGIQGTSRPIRYHVLHDDSQFSADHLQAMAYYLCHCYSRCARTVSLPAPVYFADLACRRARAHIFDKVSDFGSDTMSQRSGSGGDTETAISEDELIRSSTVHDLLKMRMYFT